MDALHIEICQFREPFKSSHEKWTNTSSRSSITTKIAQSIRWVCIHLLAQLNVSVIPRFKSLESSDNALWFACVRGVSIILRDSRGTVV